MLGIDGKILKEISSSNGIASNNNALPFLQEFFENIDLEEIADDLLNDLHTSLEADDAEVAEIQGNECSLSGSMVGCSQSTMESAQDRNCYSVMSSSSCSSTSTNSSNSSCSDDDFIDSDIHDVKEEPIMHSYNTIINNSENKIFYADEVPIPEMCFEIENDDIIVNSSSSSMDEDTKICLNNLENSSRIDQLISPIPPLNEYDDLKSPINPYSDCGYSSQGSPSSIQELVNNDDFNFLELFPSLA